MNDAEFVLLSPHFRLSEFIRSQTATRRGIDMTPPAKVLDNLRRLCVTILEPLRAELGPIQISSGYRPPELNTIIGGAVNSAHLTGCAADILVVNTSVQGVFEYIKNRDNKLVFDQVIDEFQQWTHVAVADGTKPRYQALVARRDRFGKTRYTDVSKG